MKIIIDKSKLLKPLSHIQSVVERKNTIPILSNVIISANDDKLSLSATDMDIDILEKINCNVINSGSVTVTAHILYDIVRKLTDGSEVEIEYNDGTASLTSNKSKFQLPVLPVEDYPTLSKGDFPISFKLTVGELSRLIDKTKFAISMEETRYYLNGIFIHKHEKTLVAVATDGHRLARTTIPLPSGGEIIKGAIIPRKAIFEIRKLIEDYAEDSDLSISLSDSRIKIFAGETTITSKLIDGNFPDYEKVIPVDNSNVLILDCQSLTESVDRVSTIFSDKSKSVRMTLSPNKLTLEANSPDTGSASEEIEINYSSDEIGIGFNARYLLDVTSQIGTGNIKIALKDSGAPALISVPDDPESLFVLMPMRV
jgi:DNA polymerase-3 subunit beta